MADLGRIRLWLRALLRPGAVERELFEEIRHHLEMETDKNIRAGMNPAAARRRAMIDFGGEERFREQAREARPSRPAENVLTDLRMALRRLRKAPGFSALTVLTLALGIGATTAIFSVVSGVLLEPLPYDEPENLVYITTYYLPETGLDFPEYWVGSPEYFDFRNATRTMEGVAAAWTEQATLGTGEGDPEVVEVGRASPSLFTLLRTPPLLGRAFVEADGGAEPAPVLLLSYDLWQRRFGGDSTVVGRSVSLGVRMSDGPTQSEFEIVGVMPPGFSYPGDGVQLWAPALLDPARTWRGGHWFRMVGRLAQGVSYEEADAEMKAINAQWAEIYPDHHQGHGLFMKPLLEHEVGEARSALILLLGAVLFVLLIACANVASLLLARSEGRRREVAVRSALGAGRGRIFQGVLTESFVLALAGGLLGLFLALAGTRALLALEPGNLPRLHEIGTDARVLGFTAGVVFLTTFLFGLVPALQEAMPNPGAALRDASARTTAGTRPMRLRKGIVMAEVALSVLLVVGAGLMVRSFRNLLVEDPGFNTENLLFADFSLPAADYSVAEAVAFYHTLVQDIRDLPGVTWAAIAGRVPLLRVDQDGEFHIEGRPRRTIDRDMCCVGTPIMVGEGMFETLEIPLVRGRYLTAEDEGSGAPPVAVVDEAAAERYWPGEDPMGQRVDIGAGLMEVVGVVGSVTYDGPGMEWPTVYLRPWDFIPRVHSQTVVIRTAGDPDAMVEEVRGVLRRLDSRQAVAGTVTMEEIQSRSLARPRFILTLMGAFAGVALLLGAIGIYGVISHGVALRSGEIGIRRALGAQESEVLGMVLKEGMSLTVVGLALGLAGALACTRILTGFLHGVSPTDPLTFVAVAAVILIVAALAAFFPARRASGVDPLEALRVE